MNPYELPSLRDFFAMATLQGLLASRPQFEGEPEDMAAMAYEQADAMLAARVTLPEAQ